MSDDYILRLRRELLRAGATTQARRRRARAARRLRPVAVAAAVALLALAAVVAIPERASDETPAERTAGGIALTYRAEPPDAAAAAADVLRARLAAAGVEDAGVSAGAGGRLVISAPGAQRATVTALVQPGRFAIYDWERSVLGPRGVPAPADPDVTGAPDAGSAAAVSKAEAEARAARSPDGRAVRAERGGWFALADEPALTNADVARARSAVEAGGGEPIVVVDLSADGQAAFSALTRELARRGSARPAGDHPVEANQHLAIVIDDVIVSVPFIDFRAAPDGIDGSSGAQIQGGLTPESARRLAAVLSAGPLPADLQLLSVADDGR